MRGVIPEVRHVTLLVKFIIFLKIMFWVAVAYFVYALAPEIGEFFSGALARFDFALGYKS